MTKITKILIVLILFISTLGFAQDNSNVGGETHDNQELIYDTIINTNVQRFGSELPNVKIYRRRRTTDKKYIFEKYIVDQLLKSNRILY